MGDEILKKIDMFVSESRVKGAKIEGMRPIQFMNWWGKFRPGDRVDAYFGEDYINFGGTNAEGHFAGVKKEDYLDDETDIEEFKSSEGRIWNFV
jgi:hypothetical protein